MNPERPAAGPVSCLFSPCFNNVPEEDTHHIYLPPKHSEQYSIFINTASVKLHTTLDSENPCFFFFFCPSQINTSRIT